MDLRMEVYSPTLELLGMLEIQRSVIWEERAFGAGSFSLESLISEESRALLIPENIIWIEGDTAGVIEYVLREASAEGPYITVKGRTLTGILDRRILWGLYNLQGTPPAIMNCLVNDCCINPTRGDSPELRKIPGLVILNPPTGGDSIRVQKTGGTLLEALEEIGEAYGVAFGVRFNPEVPRMEFWTRWGQNRSVNQTGNEPVFYSTELDDVLSSEYSYNSQDWRNVALVAGEGEGNDRKMVVVEAEAPAEPKPPEPGKYTITLSVDPVGGGTVQGGREAESGSNVTVSASPSEGYTFVGWRENGEIVSTDLTYSFTVTGNRNLTAVFASATPTYTISATISPTGSGTVTGAGQYQEGATVTLVASPADGYKFGGWKEGGQTVSTGTTYNFTATANRTFVAAFEEKPASRLPDGYTELQYILTNEDFGIDTGIKPRSGASRIVMDIESQSADANYFFFGTNSVYVTAVAKDRWLNLFQANSTEFGYRDNSNSYGTIPALGIGVRGTIDYNAYSKSLTVGSEQKTLNTGTYQLPLLYLGKPANNRKTISYKLYSAKVYLTTTLQRDFVPCKNPDGVVGLYDLVGKAFYQNAWTGSPTAGPEI